MRFMRVLMVLGVILGVIVGSGAISDAQSTLGRGAVVALRNTPHIWVADDVGVLHWAGDTRALATRTGVPVATSSLVTFVSCGEETPGCRQAFSRWVTRSTS